MPPEIPDVVGGTPIEADWGNPIRSRTVQRYADAATRASSDPTPEAGAVSYVADRGRLEYYHGGAWLPLFPPGVIMPFGGTNAPPGFLMCQGQEVSRTTYDALFAVIGTAYGAGDGATTFNLPDFRGRYPMGVATSGAGNSLGATFGSKDHTHSIPAHTHGAGSLATASAGNHSHSVPNTSTTGAHTHSGPAHTHSVGNTGSAGSHSHSAGLPSNSTNVYYQSGSTFVSPASPNHSHTINSAGSHSHSVPNTGSSGTGATGSAGGHSHTVGNTNSTGAHTHGISGSVASGGSGNTGSNNPPTLTTNFIISY